MIYDAAVVGSGFSAIAVTINLLRLLPPSASIVVVGDDPGFGRGTAYRTELNLHRLNVPAGRMSVFPDVPDDFVAWLQRQGRDVSADDFASRSDYGLYIRDTLASIIRARGNRASIDFVKAKASACVQCREPGVIFQLDNGETFTARHVALCLGVGSAALPVPPDGVDRRANASIVRNPWKLGWMSKIDDDDDLCILGSGLTMIDQVLALRAHGHRGRIHVLSRRGLVPHPHSRLRAPPVAPVLPEGTRELSALLAALRRQVRTGADWRSVMDGLRPLTQGLWQELTTAQRARFLRHGLAWWNVHRHRIAPDVFDTFDALVESGEVVVHAGFLHAIERYEGGVALRFRRRASQTVDVLKVARIINCTGMERAGLDHSPLLKEMQSEGMIAADELGLGISVDQQSRVLDRNGDCHTGIFAVGALTAGRFWEITAVPDIRVQAKNVAESIASASVADVSVAPVYRHA